MFSLNKDKFIILIASVVVFLTICYRLVIPILSPKYPPHKRNLNSQYSDRSGNEFYVEYKAEYSQALEFLKINKTIFNQTIDSFDADKQVIVSFIFPELIRYSLIRDLFETSCLEIVYINSGAEYADFSIGHFQMKPSFAEDVELYVKNDSVFRKKYSALWYYGDKTKKQVRKHRLEKLQDIRFQLFYASAFYEIIRQKFETDISDISFYAAAYNLGLNRKKEDIIRHTKRNSFPHGDNFPLKQYNYSEISLYFYRNHYSPIFKTH